MIIQLLDESRLDLFFEYLSKHISENGIENTILFLPFSREQSTLPEALKKQMTEGIYINIFEPNWRKVWIAIEDNGAIVGHIDIKSHPMLNTGHRVIMGMGVDAAFRGKKIGESLLVFLIDYCRKNEKIEWLDLQVLATNFPAVNLYKKMNFNISATQYDLFRIEGKSYDYLSMTLNVVN